LSFLSFLRVTARTSSFFFRGKEADIREIGARLNAENILEGSVRKAGTRIRVTAQLVSAADGYHLWSQRFDREMTDVFAIQDEICQAIVDKLRIHLEAGRPLVKRCTDSIEAYSFYLKARYQLDKLTPESLPKCREYYQQAIAADPNYARAWCGLAYYYWHLGVVGDMTPEEANALSNQATLKALELDEMLAEAHGMMGALRANDFDWKGAEHEFNRALELDPKSEEVWEYYDGFYLVPLRRLDEAVVASQRAVQLDPLSAYQQWRLGNRYYLNRQWDNAMKQFQNALELDPRYYLAHGSLGSIYFETGKIDEGIQAFETVMQLLGRTPWALGPLGLAYAIAGRIGDAQNLLKELQELAQKKYVPAIDFAFIYLGLGEMERFFDWIEKAVDQRDGLILNIVAEPGFETLRPHPRYQALLRKMNLAP
jgi:Tfp pilus assembly protein PilF